MRPTTNGHRETIMLRKKRIYCIEGHWNYGKREVEPSVEPILQMLQGLGHWEYARRDCATEEEMFYWLDHEWTRCTPGSVLYFATHGNKGEIYLSGNVSVPMVKIGKRIGKRKRKNCWIHFGGCEVLKGEDTTITEFMTHSGATVVSGYAAEIAWADTADAPALALELMLFSSIQDIELGDLSHLKSTADEVSNRFKDCGFALYTKESV